MDVYTVFNDFENLKKVLNLKWALKTLKKPRICARSEK